MYVRCACMSSAATSVKGKNINLLLKIYISYRVCLSGQAVLAFPCALQSKDVNVIIYNNIRPTPRQNYALIDVIGLEERNETRQS